MELTFWGVRGSIPTPVAENLGFGGNTACLTIRDAGLPLLIFDAGSGIRSLGNTLTDARVHIFLTHFHWDHIQGLPYFAPVYDPHCAITIHSSHEAADLERLLTAQMKPPYYPVETQAQMGYQKIHAAGARIGDVLVRPFALNHPNGATGYRIESAGRAIVYASDHEHGDAAADSVLREYAHGADVLIYDAQYTPEEYVHHRGWGHSTWRQGTLLARDAGVKQLILFHHDPLRSDWDLAQVVLDAQQEFENTSGAREGWSISV